MKTISTTRKINASPARVFAVVAHLDEWSDALPHVIKFEFLTEQKSGVGTRFCETRLMGKSEAVTELEVTEYTQDERIRLVGDSHGAEWDTVWTVEADGEGSVLKIDMDARSYKLMAKIMNKLFRGMIAKAVEKDVDLIKAYCEKG